MGDSVLGLMGVVVICCAVPGIGEGVAEDVGIRGDGGDDISDGGGGGDV